MPSQGWREVGIARWTAWFDGRDLHVLDRLASQDADDIEGGERRSRAAKHAVSKA
jgi:hypothetical protein